MLKFIWGKGHQPTAERLKLQKELFGFSKPIQHGFPNKPTALEIDPELKLLAIGTKQGLLRVYGRPGVEFYGEHAAELKVTKIAFLPGQGRLVTLTEDNFLHLWEINGSSMKEIKSTHLEGRLKQVSVMCVDSANRRMLLGTEGGNVYFLNLWNFQIDDSIIFQDLVMKNSPEDFKVNPGAVEALLLHPTDNDRILLGYARGLLVLWDRKEEKAIKTYVANQQLESVSWRGSEGEQFVSAHNDGSYIIWSTNSSSDEPEPLEPPNTPYGPYPCKAISKIQWAADNGNTWMVFNGGMPRASYGDKHTVTVMKGEEKHTVFDLSSKAIDFLIMNNDSGAPSALLILTEEELVAIDLTDDSWPVHKLPYLSPIHASAITCLTHVAQVDSQVYDQIQQAGETERKQNKLSEREWPVSGGEAQNSSEESEGGEKDVLITGHEDGSVKFWTCGGPALTCLVTVKTKPYFVGDDLDEPCEDEDMEEEWPPFRKIGSFDPYTDDYRLAIKKVAFCAKSGRLIVGGTAGQVVTFELNMEGEPKEESVSAIQCTLVTEKDGFTWKGHTALAVKSNDVKIPLGFQPSSILQVSPPASINSIGYCDEWKLMAAGTAHGLVVFDCLQNITINTKCTLNAQDIANADDNPMSRRKSLKKSLRESFRRLRKGRSQRNIDKKKGGSTADTIKKEPPKFSRADSPVGERPVERAIEARAGSEYGEGSMVRCLHFAHTYIANPQTISCTLWAGTNSGQVLIFLLNIPVGEEKRKTDKASAMLAKEIQLKHKAPVLSVQVLDAGGVPIPEPRKYNSPDGEAATTQPHRVLIASEEQFKLFILPTLKPSGKYKLTAHEGARVRRVGFVTFAQKSNPDYTENCFTCLTNQGDLAIHSLPELRRQVLQTECMRKEDVIGISSLVFTPKGEAFYQRSSSELQRVSVAATNHLELKGKLTLAPDARYEIKDDTPIDKKLDDKVVIGGASPSLLSSNKSDENADAADTEARQNRLNEKQAQGSKSAINGDGQEFVSGILNDTTVSDISADITVDSVREHSILQSSTNLVASTPISNPPPEVVVTDTAETTTTERKELSSSSSHQMTTTVETTMTKTSGCSSTITEETMEHQSSKVVSSETTNGTNESD